MFENNPKTEFNHIQEKLQEIKDQDGIIGYILRDSQSASIDLKDPKRIIDYATLSSASFDTGNNMTKTLQIGKMETIVLETEETKLLSLDVNNNRITIFMEKKVNHEKICKNLK